MSIANATATGADASLLSLDRHKEAQVLRVAPTSASDAIARRLGELGFVPGERVRVLAHGPFGKDPLLVQVGYTRFALRRDEAARIYVQPL